MDDRILIAQIGAAHGIKGDVRVKCFGDDPSALETYSPLHGEDGRRYRIAQSRPAKGTMLVVRFKGVSDRNAAESLNGIRLYIDRNQLPAPDDDEFYLADLIGCTVRERDAGPIGRVIAVPNFGAGDLLEIALDAGGSTLVPFERSFVPEVDIAARVVVVAPIVDDDDPEPDAD
ncbi:MAG: ribosome maturation factor RimM [Pseudomonadota bacterium]